jgi:hypothetical protein
LLGFTLIVEVFAPVLHVYDVAAPAVNKADCPLQMVDEDALMVALELTVIVAVVEVVHVPIAPVTV